MLQPNHLLGYRRSVLQLIFRNMNDFFAVRRELLPIVSKNQANMDAVDAYAEVVGTETQMDLDFGDGETPSTSNIYVQQAARAGGSGQSVTESIIDIREYDVPYYLRVAIDKGRCFHVESHGQG